MQIRKSLSRLALFLGMSSVVTVSGFVSMQESALGQSRRTFTINNNSGQTVEGLYLSPSSDDSWGSNDINSNLFSGNSVSYTLTGACSFDLLVVLTNGQEVQQNNIDTCLNSSYTVPSNPYSVSPGGDPQAINDCMQDLLYKRRPVCTRGSCARLGSPAENANNNFGGWQWQTVRTEISESAAVQACQNAR